MPSRRIPSTGCRGRRPAASTGRASTTSLPASTRISLRALRSQLLAKGREVETDRVQGRRGGVRNDHPVSGPAGGVAARRARCPNSSATCSARVAWRRSNAACRPSTKLMSSAPTMPARRGRWSRAGSPRRCSGWAKPGRASRRGLRSQGRDGFLLLPVDEELLRAAGHFDAARLQGAYRADGRRHGGAAGHRLAGAQGRTSRTMSARKPLSGSRSPGQAFVANVPGWPDAR